jgi:hypothetical protein
MGGMAVGIFSTGKARRKNLEGSAASSNGDFLFDESLPAKRLDGLVQAHGTESQADSLAEV